MPDTYVLECREVTRRFGAFVAVDQVSLAIESGSFFSILGPSGCGKTTLLRMLAGFDEPEHGEIYIQGESMRGVPPNHRPVNMVFQHLALFPMMTVADNVAYGLKRRGVARGEIGTKVAQALERVSLPEAGGKRINQLSGGQKQRVAIARALVLEPTVLLLDEPLGALDLKLREHMKVELKQLQKQIGTTFVYITHDQSEALVMSDQIAVMNHGRFEQIGTPQELYFEPATAFVASFVGEANRWRGKVSASEGGNLTVEIAGGVALQAHTTNGIASRNEVEIFVRPEAIGLSREARQDVANQLQCTVQDILFNGANTQVLLREQGTGHTLVAALPGTGDFLTIKRDDTLFANWDRRHTRCFSADAAE
ncbi:MAG: ABC transporter ATP-binding protein [Proteobacteria bacterium]|nr:MAG: ABC transporter ATP-binding protein [Pseudomonadota bacterium]